MSFDDLISAARDRFATTDILRGLFVAGSFGNGTADEWSDLDLVGLAEPDDHKAIVALWREILGGWAPQVYWQEFGWGGTLVNAIAEDWRRVDLYLVPRAGFTGRAQSTVTAVIDRDGVWQDLPAALPDATPDAARTLRTIREFIRVMGLMPVGVGREEWVTLVTGVGLLRDMLASLLLEDCPAADRGGILHLRKLLPPEDITVLEALPYPAPDRDAVVAAHMALAAAFFPRARTLAIRLGIDWPEEFEAAMRKRLQTALDLELPGARPDPEPEPDPEQA